MPVPGPHGAPSPLPATGRRRGRRGSPRFLTSPTALRVTSSGSSPCREIHAERPPAHHLREPHSLRRSQIAPDAEFPAPHAPRSAPRAPSGETSSSPPLRTSTRKLLYTAPGRGNGRRTGPRPPGTEKRRGAGVVVRREPAPAVAQFHDPRSLAPETDREQGPGGVRGEECIGAVPEEADPPRPVNQREAGSFRLELHHASGRVGEPTCVPDGVRHHVKWRRSPRPAVAAVAATQRDQRA